MFLLVLAIAVGSILLTVVGLLIYARWNYGTLEALNIPVVDRSFFLGSTPELHKKVQHLEDIERFNKYGPIYGVYEGRTPHIHVCDPELIRLIFVKDSDHFRNRREVELGDPIVNEMLDFLPYAKWKVLRQMQTPSLTASKLKIMSTRVNESAAEFVSYMGNKLEGSNGRAKFNTREVFVPLAIDIICRGLIGIPVHNPFDYSNEVCQSLETISAEGQDSSILYTLSFSFPFLSALAPTLAPDNIHYFANMFRKLIKVRSEDSIKNNDFMDKIVDMMHKLPTDEFKKLNVSEATVIAQALGPLMAGYDAIAAVSVFLSYYAARDPQVQQRITQEVDDHFEKYGEFRHENLGELAYLHACVKETLRLVPSFIRPERICTKDWEYNGLRIPAGVVVMIPAWGANRNPEYFPDPEKFDPERFMDEQSTGLSQYAFSTFGHGPRNCIGLKFAYDALKLSLCHVFRKFQFELRPDTEVKYKTGVLFLMQYYPILLDVVRRET
ncbi:unnamed protein product [Allacma fusca]|uniref:Cytochrome P450 n=1 Tax=Allacma fusca TaxID=39272 RepID=A0A8J2K0Y7_9HEXA|nr:unnamed protein product [Allacma fusca]